MNKDKLTELRATAPAALEDISEEAWREFQALQKSREQQFQPTQPMSNAAPLQRTPAPARPGTRDTQSVTVDQALQIARLNNRVCPMPQQWKAMFDLMQSSAPPHAVPPVVIDGAAWNIVPAMQKRIRLREQLEWAGRFNLLAPVVAFMQGLPEEDWLHF